jgi:hypothetical protein
VRRLDDDTSPAGRSRTFRNVGPSSCTTLPKPGGGRSFGQGDAGMVTITTYKVRPYLTKDETRVMLTIDEAVPEILDALS